MKRIVYLFVALLMMATADAQRLRVGDGTSGMTLTERQKGLAACACLMAQGDMNRLEPTVPSIRSSATSTCHTSSRSSGSRSGILRTDPLRRQTLAVLAGREGEVFLEHASEVLGVFEAEEVGSLDDGVA